MTARALQCQTWTLAVDVTILVKSVFARLHILAVDHRAGLPINEAEMQPQIQTVEVRTIRNINLVTRGKIRSCSDKAIVNCAEVFRC